MSPSIPFDAVWLVGIKKEPTFRLVLFIPPGGGLLGNKKEPAFQLVPLSPPYPVLLVDKKRAQLALSSFYTPKRF